ncbi:metalloendoproteinase 5-MMP-like [Primulina tabacum]|uniref:metalloendoproteinase 5-MMP-like n=1 Tax=Primulina tabacum TaxID=48773 RepID=UPI003F5ADB49
MACRKENKICFYLECGRTHVKQPLEHALQRWASSVSPLKFYRVKKFAQADIWISFLRGYHGDEFPFDGANGHVAHAFGPPDGRSILIRPKIGPLARGTTMGLDMETLGLREFGHALGLGHIEVQEAIMYPIINPTG